MNPITMQLVADKYIRLALEEDIHSEDVSTNAVMPEYKKGEVQLICKEDGIIAGLGVFERVFTLLDESTKVAYAKKDGVAVKDGDRVEKGQLLATVTGDIRRAHRIKLFTAFKRDRNLYKQRCFLAGRHQYQTARYQKNNALHAYF